MKKLLILVLVLVLAVSCFGGCAKEQESLIVYTEAGFPPFEYYEGTKVVGVDMDIAAAIAKELNMKLVIKDVAFDSIVAGISEDNALGLAGITIDAERKEAIDFSVPYFFDAVQYVIYKGDIALNNGKAPQSIFVGKKVGIQTGTTGDMLITGIDGATVKHYNNALIATQDLGGGCDYVVIDSYTALEIQSANKDLKVAAIENAAEEYAVAVKKGNKKLLDSVNKVIEKLLKDGSIDQFMKNHESAAA